MRLYQLTTEWYDSKVCEPESVMLLRNNPNKEAVIDNLRSIALLNAELKILGNVLTKKVDAVREWTCRGVTNSAIIGKSFHNNLHFLCYTLEKVNRIPGKSGSIAHLDQTKSAR